MIRSYEQNMIDEIDAILPGAFEHLEEISSVDPERAFRICAVILGYCCVATNDGAIRSGRKAFKKLPSEWLVVNLPSIITQTINLEDEWDYRRLLEVLRESNNTLLGAYITKGLNSSDVEINEAARDFTS